MFRYFKNWSHILFTERKYCVYIISNKDQTELKILQSDRTLMPELLRQEQGHLHSSVIVLYERFFAGEADARFHCSTLTAMQLEDLVDFISRHNPDWRSLRLM